MKNEESITLIVNSSFFITNSILTKIYGLEPNLTKLSKYGHSIPLRHLWYNIRVHARLRDINNKHLSNHLSCHVPCPPVASFHNSTVISLGDKNHHPHSGGGVSEVGGWPAATMAVDIRKLRQRHQFLVVECQACTTFFPFSTPFQFWRNLFLHLALSLSPDTPALNSPAHSNTPGHA